MTLDPFSAWAGPHHPQILFVGEAWGEQEDYTKQPFVGTSGKEFWKMLGRAFRAEDDPSWLAARSHFSYEDHAEWLPYRKDWMEAKGLAFTNVLNFRPPSNKIANISVKRDELPATYPSIPSIDRGLYLHPQYLPELDRLEEEVREARPNLIVALGNTACWALLQTTSIGSIRGAITQCRGRFAAINGSAGSPLKVLPAFHPASIIYMWKQRPVLIADLGKAELEGKFPEIRRPKRGVLVDALLSDIINFTSRMTPLDTLSVDVETRGGQITCIGFARRRDDAIVVPFADSGKEDGSYWQTPLDEIAAWNLVEALLVGPWPKLFQNGLYDIQYILRAGIRPQNCLHDTMLYHHAMWPEMRKNLGFLGSIYTNEPAWKLMRRAKTDTVKRDE